MSEVKKVMVSEDIVFEEAGITFPKGLILTVESVEENGITLFTEDGARYMIDFETFENGFEIAPLDA